MHRSGRIRGQLSNGRLQSNALTLMMSALPIDMNIPCLSDPMAAVLCLGVHGRVPVAVVEDNGVGASQVDSQATTSRGQDETEQTRVAVEAFHHHLVHVNTREQTQTQTHTHTHTHRGRVSIDCMDKVAAVLVYLGFHS